MTAVAAPAATKSTPVPAPSWAPAAGLELLGPMQGSGYTGGSALVRRADGQIVQVGPLLYALLESLDGVSDSAALARTMSERLERRIGGQQVEQLASKLAHQGLLAGTEHSAPPKRNPLLALRWRVLVTDSRITKGLSAPFTFMFRPWIMWPVVAAFGAVCWFVLIHKGVASATAQSFNHPGLLLLVFALAVISAGVHELGHASACRYGGATPGGMGVGLYLVWPAFYTDVTDAYRLDRRSRLRVDLAGLYFNAAFAVVTMGVWLAMRVDALLLLVALQLLQMVRQLSPVIRADGYHILSDATGVPDLYAHLGPTLRRLLPRHWRDPSPVRGWSRVLITLWVLIIVPVLLSLMVTAVLLLPRLGTSAWDSGRHLALQLPQDVGRGETIRTAATVLQLVALFLPVAGSFLITQKFLRTTIARSLRWSAGHRRRQAAVLSAGLLVVTGLVWAWWPARQYRPVRADEGGTIPSLIRLVGDPKSPVQPHATLTSDVLAPGTYLAAAMIPARGATPGDPALFVVPRSQGRAPVAILSDGSDATGPRGPSPASTFPFTVPPRPGRDGTQAVALGTKNGAVTYDVVYSLITISGGRSVTETNGAYALADCRSCTTVAVSFQIVLVVGQSNVVAPVDEAVAANYDCPACATTAVADQMVVTLKSTPTAVLDRELENSLRQLDALSELGASGTPAVVASQVAAVEQQVGEALNESGLLANPIATSTTSSRSAGSSSGSAGTVPATTNSTLQDTGEVPGSPSTTQPKTTVTSSPQGSTTTSSTTTSSTTSSTSTSTSTTTSVPSATT
jgi:putative peptide zinc metalloprotease protein